MFQLIQNLRSLEFVERVKRLKNATPQQLELKQDKNSKPLHIVYVLTHVSICGGVKVILQHANGLKQLGMKITLVSHFPKPDWYPIEADYISVPFGIELTRGIPLCDVIVATYWDHIHACIETGIAPVVYFEQGDFHLFDPMEKVDIMPHIQQQMQLPPHIITISNPVKEIIKDRFGRDSLVFPNALDTEVFYPKVDKEAQKYMMIVGSDKSNFKGIHDLIKAFNIVKERGYDIELLWLTPVHPETPIGEVYVNPPQSQIGDLYRKASIYVCGSYYEAFSLPCLEAMASGTPVVTTRTPGVAEYAKDGHNCLMVDPGDVQGLADRIIRLLEQEDLYKQFQSTGLETAKQYSWKYILKDLFQFYQEVSQYRVKPKYELHEWTLFLEDKTFEDSDAEERLERFLSQTDTNEVYGPVEYHLIPDIPFYRWERLAKRNTPLPEGKTEKILLNAKGNELHDWSGKELAEKFQSGDFIGVISKARELLTHLKEGSLEQGVYLRWVIHSLLELRQYKLAQDLLSKTLQSHPYYTDLYFLQTRMARKMNSKTQLSTYKQIVQFLQEAAYYPEYLNLKEMMKDEGNKSS